MVEWFRKDLLEVLHNSFSRPFGNVCLCWLEEVSLRTYRKFAWVKSSDSRLTMSGASTNVECVLSLCPLCSLSNHHCLSAMIDSDFVTVPCIHCGKSYLQCVNCPRSLHNWFLRTICGQSSKTIPPIDLWKTILPTNLWMSHLMQSQYLCHISGFTIFFSVIQSRLLCHCWHIFILLLH